MKFESSALQAAAVGSACGVAGTSLSALVGLSFFLFLLKDTKLCLDENISFSLAAGGTQRCERFVSSELCDILAVSPLRENILGCILRIPIFRGLMKRHWANMVLHFFVETQLHVF